MATIACPWCESDQPVSMATFAEGMEEPFTCAECGTTVLFVDEKTPFLALAA
ncbi:hypothetical protein BH23CHL8_BH23CHL8_22750 [soil metagenome]